jgi:hypothetical protein
VLAPLTIIGCELLLLEALDPAGCLSIQVLETQLPGKFGVARAQVELLATEVFVEVFSFLHNCH